MHKHNSVFHTPGLPPKPTVKLVSYIPLSLLQLAFFLTCITPNHGLPHHTHSLFSPLISCSAFSCFHATERVFVSSNSCIPQHICHVPAQTSRPNRLPTLMFSLSFSPSSLVRSLIKQLALPGARTTPPPLTCSLAVFCFGYGFPRPPVTRAARLFSFLGFCTCTHGHTHEQTNPHTHRQR